VREEEETADRRKEEKEVYFYLEYIESEKKFFVDVHDKFFQFLKLVA
jgi:hypothetical protein